MFLTFDKVFRAVPFGRICRRSSRILRRAGGGCGLGGAGRLVELKRKLSL